MDACRWSRRAGVADCSPTIRRVDNTSLVRRGGDTVEVCEGVGEKSSSESRTKTSPGPVVFAAPVVLLDESDLWGLQSGVVDRLHCPCSHQEQVRDAWLLRCRNAANQEICSSCDRAMIASRPARPFWSFLWLQEAGHPRFASWVGLLVRIRTRMVGRYWWRAAGPFTTEAVGSAAFAFSCARFPVGCCCSESVAEIAAASLPPSCGPADETTRGVVAALALDC